MALMAFAADQPDSIAQSLGTHAAGLVKPHMKFVEWTVLVPLLLEVLPLLLGGICKKPAAGLIEGMKSDSTDRLLVAVTLRRAVDQVADSYEMEALGSLHKPTVRACVLSWLDSCDSGQAQALGNQLNAWNAAWA